MKKVSGQNMLKLKEGLEEIKRRIDGFFLANPGRRMVILIGAGSGAGKTEVVTKKIADMYPGRVRVAKVINQDNLYKGSAFMESEKAKGNILNWDQPEAVDIELCEQLIEKLARGEAVPEYKYNFDGNPPTIVGEISPPDIIIVEGLYGLLQKRVDLGIFVHAGTHGRMMRRLLRDLDRTSMDSSQILGYFAGIVEPMHVKYIEPTRVRADIIIDNDYDPEVEASRTKLAEKQLKFNVIDQKANILNILTKKRMERISTMIQEDEYYNIKGKDLIKAGEIIRIRTESGICKIFTYKGPEISSSGGALRERFKHEFEITPEAEMNLLTLLEGPVVTVKKERRMYRWKGIDFAVDFGVSISKNGDTRNLGNFIEVRPESTEDEWKINLLLAELGLQARDGIKAPYSEM